MKQTAYTFNMLQDEKLIPLTAIMKFILIVAIFCEVSSQPDKRNSTFLFPAIYTPNPQSGGAVIMILDKRSAGEKVSNVGEARKECKNKYNAILATPFSKMSANQLVQALKLTQKGKH